MPHARTSDIALPTERGVDPSLPLRESVQRQREFFTSERQLKQARPPAEKLSLNPLKRLGQRVGQLSKGR